MGKDALLTQIDPPSALARAVRDRFWELDPLGVGAWAESTYSEYFDIADRTAARAEGGEDLRLLEAELGRELRDEWELVNWAQLSHEILDSIRSEMRRADHRPTCEL